MFLGKTLKSSSLSLSPLRSLKMGTCDLSWKPDEIRGGEGGGGFMCHAMETRLNSSWIGELA